MLENFHYRHTLEELSVQLAEKVTYISNSDTLKITTHNFPFGVTA